MQSLKETVLSMFTIKVAWASENGESDVCHEVEWIRKRWLLREKIWCNGLLKDKWINGAGSTGRCGAEVDEKGVRKWEEHVVGEGGNNMI